MSLTSYSASWNCSDPLSYVSIYRRRRESNPRQITKHRTGTHAQETLVPLGPNLGIWTVATLHLKRGLTVAIKPQKQPTVPLNETPTNKPLNTRHTYQHWKSCDRDSNPDLQITRLIFLANLNYLNLYNIWICICTHSSRRCLPSLPAIVACLVKRLECVSRIV